MTARPGLLIVPGGQYQIMISTASRPARTAGSASASLPRLLQRPGPVERQTAQRGIRLILDRAVGHHLAGLAQPGVMRQVLPLNALEFRVIVVRRVLRRPQQHQLERFEIHTSL